MLLSFPWLSSNILSKSYLFKDKRDYSERDRERDRERQRERQRERDRENNYNNNNSLNNSRWFSPYLVQGIRAKFLRNLKQIGIKLNLVWLKSQVYGKYRVKTPLEDTFGKCFYGY